MSRLARISLAFLAAPLALVAPDGRAGDVPAQAAAAGRAPEAGVLDPMDPANWEIGPVINGQVLPLNMPPHPSRHPDGWSIDFPHPTEDAGSVHYVTMPSGPLTGKTRMVLEYRIETDGARLVPRRFADKRGSMTLYFQRAGDNWTRRFEAYRWYAISTTHEPLPGAASIVAPFDGGWISMMWRPSEGAPEDFKAALAEASRVGFVLGGGDGLGHGAYATGPFRLVVTSFRIE